MTELEEVLQKLKLEYGLEQCALCEGTTVMRDAVGFPWCADHEHHGKVLGWGRRHGYPPLDLRTHKIGSGEHNWWFAVFTSVTIYDYEGDENFMWTALMYIEDFDSREIAS